MMKRILFSLAFFAFLVVGAYSFAQETETTTPPDSTNIADSTEVVDTTNQAAAGATDEMDGGENEIQNAPKEVEVEKSGHQVIKDYFLEGGGFMFPVLICLILGLAVCIERIISLNLKTVNSTRLLNDLEGKFKSGDIESAKLKVRETRGPIASIFYQALDRRNEGVEIVEKSIVAYGSVQMGLLEKGLSWISLFIAIAPMLGFMGTVIGMIEAFDRIESMGDISPSIVAGGIKIALLTTVAGLIVAVILQIFYNYLIAKVDSLVNDMEDSSISLVDMMIKYNVVNKKTNP